MLLHLPLLPLWLLLGPASALALVLAVSASGVLLVLASVAAAGDMGGLVHQRSTAVDNADQGPTTATPRAPLVRPSHRTTHCTPCVNNTPSAACAQ